MLGVDFVADFMSLQIREIDDDSMTLVLSKTDTSVANALRRVMISEVPTMAIDLVEVIYFSFYYCYYYYFLSSL